MSIDVSGANRVKLPAKMRIIQTAECSGEESLRAEMEPTSLFPVITVPVRSASGYARNMPTLSGGMVPYSLIPTAVPGVKPVFQPVRIKLHNLILYRTERVNVTIALLARK